jgi:hypothetical protein
LWVKTAVFNIDEAAETASFKEFECPDLKFIEDAYPMFKSDLDFTEADIENADLRKLEANGRIDLTNADLTDARLLGADLQDAVLEAALFSRARLVGTNLQGAYLYQASIGDANIDLSTDFGERVVYDPDSKYDYDPSLGLDAESSTESPSPPQKAKEVYQSIYDSARQSGDSGKAIDAYLNREKMETKLVSRGDRGHSLSDSVSNIYLSKFFGWLRWVFGSITGYGVGTKRLLGIGFGIMILSAGALWWVGTESTTATYAIGGFVGTTPGLDATLPVRLIVGIEALLGTVLIALYINARGRRSSM